MNSNLNFIGVDLGGESGRVMVAAFDGKRITLDEKHRFDTGGSKVGQTLRWDVNLFWSQICEGLQRVAAENIDVSSVGVDTWGVDYVLLDQQDEMLGLPYHYRDQRNVGTLAEITKTLSRAEIFSRTGIQFMEINTLCQLFAAAQSRSLTEARCLLTIPDFFHWKLSGFKGVEFTNATTTQCFDPQQRTWANTMLDSLGIPSAILPEVFDPGTNLGSLTSGVSQATGLKDVSVVAPATHDTGSAVVAVPVDSGQVGNRWAYISSGTWSLVGIETPQPILTEEALAANVTNEGGVEGTWRVLKNVMGLWIVQRTKQAFSDRNFNRSYAELTQLASAATNNSYIDPDDASFLNPADMEEAVKAFLDRTGQQVPKSEGELILCILESLAIRYRQVLEELQRLSGVPIEVLHVVGGGSKNTLLNQLIANATGIEVIAGPGEATALGNVMMQCKTAGGVGSLGEIREVIRSSSALEVFEPQDQVIWQQKSSQFESLRACQ